MSTRFGTYKSLPPFRRALNTHKHQNMSDHPNLDSLPYELVQHTIESMDAITLLKFLTTSRYYSQFKYDEKQPWKLAYAERWCVDLQELECYEKDWKIEFKNRYLREKALIQEVEEQASNENDIAIDPDRTHVFDEYSLVLNVDSYDRLVFSFIPSSNPWYTLLKQNNSNEDTKKALIILKNLEQQGTMSDIQREVNALRLEILITSFRRNYESSDEEILTDTLAVLHGYFFNYLIAGSEVPIGLFSLMKDFLQSRPIKKQHATGYLFQSHYIELHKIVKHLVQHNMKYPLSCWTKMNFIGQLKDLLKDENHDLATRTILEETLDIARRRIAYVD